MRTTVSWTACTIRLPDSQRCRRHCRIGTALHEIRPLLFRNFAKVYAKLSRFSKDSCYVFRSFSLRGINRVLLQCFLHFMTSIVLEYCSQIPQKLAKARNQVYVRRRIGWLRIFLLSISWIMQQSGNRPVPGCCKHSHEYFGYIKMRNFLSSSSNVTPSRRNLFN